LDYQKGKALSRQCDSCHGEKGNYDKNRAMPTLAGQSRTYLSTVLKEYIQKNRHDEIMNVYSLSLDDREIEQLSLYYSQQKATRTSLPAADNAKIKRFAKKACDSCHGEAGNSINEHIPSLAGQPEKYLIKAMQDYQQRHRSDVLMQTEVAALDHKMIEAVADYYASQQPIVVADNSDFDPVAEGRRLAAACDHCHDRPYQSVSPKLSGQHPAYLIHAMGLYQRGERQHEKMQSLLKFYSANDLEKISLYYLLKTDDQADGLQRETIPADLLSRCSQCHGKKGISADAENTPNLAAQNSDYLMHAMQAYRNGDRQHQAMNTAMKNLKDEDLSTLAAYFSSQPGGKAAYYLPEYPRFIAENRCDRCHGKNGYSESDDIPRLAAQKESYLIRALVDYQNKRRKHSAMFAMSAPLSMLEIRGLAEHYARQ
jgi:cytochrome c553